VCVSANNVQQWNSDSSSKCAEHRWMDTGVPALSRQQFKPHRYFARPLSTFSACPFRMRRSNRIFSSTNSLWTAEKTQLRVSVLHAMAVNKTLKCLVQNFARSRSHRLTLLKPILFKRKMYQYLILLIVIKQRKFVYDKNKCN